MTSLHPPSFQRNDFSTCTKIDMTNVGSERLHVHFTQKEEEGERVMHK